MEIKERARDSLSKVLSEICYSDISLEIPKYVKMFTSFSRLYRKSPPPPLPIPVVVYMISCLANHPGSF